MRVSGQAIRNKYPDYSHNHDQTSYDNMLKNMRWPTKCGCYVKHRLPGMNRQTRSEHSADNLWLFNTPLTTMKRAPSQWTRILAGAKSRRARKRRKTTRADADAAETVRARVANTTANCADAAS